MSIVLYQFPISHYCEKVRWALAYKSISYQKINLLPVANLKAQFRDPPSLSNDGVLTLTGYFPTRPSQVEFDYSFLWRNNEWKVSGISLEINPVNVTKR